MRTGRIGSRFLKFSLREEVSVDWDEGERSEKKLIWIMEWLLMGRVYAVRFGSC